MKRILVTGSNSGLGKYLKKKYSAKGYSRNSNFEKIKKINWDLIIHCAFKATEAKNKNEIRKIINDNLVLSYNISRLKGKKIFISSCAVYEKQNLKSRTENNKIFLKNQNSLYAKFKLICESFFDNKTDVILRLGSIVGKEMRKNTINKILFFNNQKIFLSKKSLYSFLSYHEIFEFINLVNKKKLVGVFNILRNDYITLKDIKNKIVPQKKIKFGKKIFKVIKASNSKFIKLQKLNSNSLEVLKTLYD
jgi:dTDP-4-dehydrorhamnose reductase